MDLHVQQVRRRHFVQISVAALSLDWTVVKTTFQVSPISIFQRHFYETGVCPFQTVWVSRERFWFLDYDSDYDLKDSTLKKVVQIAPTEIRISPAGTLSSWQTRCGSFPQHWRKIPCFHFATKSGLKLLHLFNSQPTTQKNISSGELTRISFQEKPHVLKYILILVFSENKIAFPVVVPTLMRKDIG